MATLEKTHLYVASNGLTGIVTTTNLCAAFKTQNCIEQIERERAKYDEAENQQHFLVLVLPSVVNFINILHPHFAPIIWPNYLYMSLEAIVGSIYNTSLQNTTLSLFTCQRKRCNSKHKVKIIDHETKKSTTF
jgi:hypothetical protein